jgi:hypothetical protein
MTLQVIGRDQKIRIVFAVVGMPDVFWGCVLGAETLV